MYRSSHRDAFRQLLRRGERADDHCLSHHSVVRLHRTGDRESDEEQNLSTNPTRQPHLNHHVPVHETRRVTGRAESDARPNPMDHHRKVAAIHPWAFLSNAEVIRCRCRQNSTEPAHRHLHRRRIGVHRSLRIRRPGLSQHPCATCHRSWSRPIRLPEVLVLYVARPCRCVQHGRV